MTTPAYLPAPTPAADAAVMLAEGVEKLARLFIRDIRSGAHVSADRTRAQMFDLVCQIGPAMIGVLEEAWGCPAPVCQRCGRIESLDCECPDADEACDLDVVF